jgi:hypothetical protein
LEVIFCNFFAYYLLKIAKENLSKNLLLERYLKLKSVKSERRKEVNEVAIP